MNGNIKVCLDESRLGSININMNRFINDAELADHIKYTFNGMKAFPDMIKDIFKNPNHVYRTSTDKIKVPLLRLATDEDFNDTEEWVRF